MTMKRNCLVFFSKNQGHRDHRVKFIVLIAKKWNKKKIQDSFSLFESVFNENFYFKNPKQSNISPVDNQSQMGSAHKVIIPEGQESLV